MGIFKIASKSSKNLADKQRETMLLIVCIAAALIFFQAYMIAPLIPHLAEIFNVPEQRIALIVPAYMIAYGISILFYGLLSDRLGRIQIIRFSLLAFVVLTALTSTANSANDMIIWRLLTGLGASGVVPISLALIGDLYPHGQRGRPFGLVFAAMEGGMALGSTLGVILTPFVGWRILFLGTAFIAALLLWYQMKKLEHLRKLPRNVQEKSILKAFLGYRHLLSNPRAIKTYAYVFWNGIFHSAIYTWLGLYFIEHYQLGEIGIGLAILGYGVPGLIFGSLIGRTADKWGRVWLIVAGLAMASIATALMATNLPLMAAAFAVTIISLGYDLTQPLYAGIIAEIGGKDRGGQAIGLNVFALFIGFGLGSWFFGEAMLLSFKAALMIFAALQAAATVAAIYFFRTEYTVTIKWKKRYQDLSFKLIGRQKSK